MTDIKNDLTKQIDMLLAKSARFTSDFAADDNVQQNEPENIPWKITKFVENEIQLKPQTFNSNDLKNKLDLVTGYRPFDFSPIKERFDIKKNTETGKTSLYQPEYSYKSPRKSGIVNNIFNYDDTLDDNLSYKFPINDEIESNDPQDTLLFSNQKERPISPLKEYNFESSFLKKPFESQRFSSALKIDKGKEKLSTVFHTLENKGRQLSKEKNQSNLVNLQEKKTYDQKAKKMSKVETDIDRLNKGISDQEKNLGKLEDDLECENRQKEALLKENDYLMEKLVRKKLRILCNIYRKNFLKKVKKKLQSKVGKLKKIIV